MHEPIHPELFNLLLGLILPALILFLSWKESLKIEKLFIYASFRTVIQLLFAGYVIQYIFHLDSWYIIAAVLVLMSVIAAKTASARFPSALIPAKQAFLFSWIAVFAGTFIDTFLVTAVILQVDPWYNPYYLIPLGGMIMGNALNSGSLAGERFLSELKNNIKKAEMLLILGKTSREAAEPARRNALKSALIPTVNSMFTVGLVHLPGMMTGQILGGASPQTASRYQIIVMFMITSTVLITALIQIRLLEKRFFTRDHRIRYDLL